MANTNQLIKGHQEKLRSCRLCDGMIGPVVTGEPVRSPVLLVGQAPGEKEGVLKKPFAWTAGKTLFKWFNQIGLSENEFRSRVYMAAVCRCFPGKNPKGGDRVPSPLEISNCSKWLDSEIRLIRPKLLLPVGKLAISQFVAVNKLTEVIGRSIRIEYRDFEIDFIALPHPSGASTWHRTEPGKTLLNKALSSIQSHPAWQELCNEG